MEALEVEVPLEDGNKNFMKKIIVFFICCFFYNCTNYGQLKVITDLPKTLKEVSGNELDTTKKFVWMHNDSGNKPRLYGVTFDGKIVKELKIDAKNHDWEDLTKDDQGNIYIGDFGNNQNKRKNLKILKIKHSDLEKDEVTVEKIKFEYPEQKNFPPKKKARFFDTEAFFYWNNHFYIFTKSRVATAYGTSFLYRIPANSKKKHKAKRLAKFENCNANSCWITAAAISPDKTKVVLLSQKNVIVFSNFTGDDFFSGRKQVFPITINTQKEGVCFKDNNTLLITDEYSRGFGGNLYELKIE